MKPFSLITLILIGSLSLTLFAQDCNNPLLDFFGLQGLDAPESGADLQYCDGLIAGESCCSADTVASFQDRTNGIIDRLNNYAAARDLYLAQLRNSYYDRFTDLLEDINEDRIDEIARIRQANATLADQLQGDVDSFNQARNEARNINNQFVRALDEYQTARNNCFTTALQVHTSAWCLACDPNYATQGVNDDGTVTFSDSLCQAISDACTPYFNQSARFNPLIRAREAYWRLLAVSRYLRDYSNTNQLTDFLVGQDPYNPLSTQEAVTVPEVWAGQEGSCLDLWSRDEQLRDLLTIGAVAASTDDTETIVAAEEDSIVDDTETIVVVVGEDVIAADPQVIIIDAANAASSGARLLQNALAGYAGVWEPDLTATGLNVDQLRSNPGDLIGPSDYSDFFNQAQTEDNQNQAENNNNEQNNQEFFNDNTDSPTDNDTDNDDDSN